MLAVKALFKAWVVTLVAAAVLHAAGPGLVLEGASGPGKGKHIVLISGDEEYRSEEAMPQLARILSERHGFKCTVLFAIDPADGTINPDRNNNIPGLEALDNADLMIIFTRWRDLPDDQMKHIVSYIDSGRPVIGMRSATHAFRLKSSPTYARYSSDSKEWEGGFGQQVLGQTWVAHHGKHGAQSTFGLIVKDQEKHPILRGIRNGDIWGPTDTYEVALPLPGDGMPLVLGQVLEGMKKDDLPVDGKLNDPMMPVAWTKTYIGSSGKIGRVFTTTMGSAQDLEAEGLRRLLVNATYWALGMESKIKAKANADVVGDYKPGPFKIGGFIKGVKPSDLAAR